MSASDTTYARSGRDQTSAILRGLGLVVAATVGCGLLLLAPAWYLAGRQGLIAVLASVGICAVPGALVIVLIGFRAVRGPVQVLVASTGVRMAFVFGAALVIRFRSPDLAFTDFYLWLVLVYFVALAAETAAIGRLSSHSADSGSPPKAQGD